eukprot:Filipodium_phascolosomae@DN1543_c0_g1_i1.p1
MQPTSITGEPPSTDDLENLFVGWCHAWIADKDGLPKKNSGSNFYAPVHMSKTATGRVFTSYFPTEDPIKLLKVSPHPDEYLMGMMYHGESESKERNQMDSLLASLPSIPCSSFDIDNNTGVVKTKAAVPFTSNCYEKMVDLNVQAITRKLVTKVKSIEVVVPEVVFQEWKHYKRVLEDISEKRKNKK